MKNNLAIKDLLVFLMDNRKIIIISMISFVLILGGYQTFNSYKELQNTEIDETAEQKLTNNDQLIEIYNKESYELTEDEVEQLSEFLQQGAYAFKIYVQNEENIPMTSNVLVKESLITDEVIEEVERISGLTIEPSPKQAVNVYNESDSGIHTIQIGTGLEDDNQVLAEAFYEVLSTGNIPILNAMEVSFFEDEPYEVILSVREQPQIEAENLTWKDSLQAIVLMMVAGLFLGFIAGFLFSIAKLFIQKEVSIFYDFSYQNTDNIIHINNFNWKNKQKENEIIVYSTLYPKKKKSLILSEFEIKEDITKELNSSVSNSSLGNYEINKSNNLLSISNKINFDEIIFLVEKNKTTKKWYENQRLLSTNFNVPVKVIQF